MPKMNATILVVEDETDVALMLRYNLEAEGFKVLIAYSGDEAAERLRETIPDLILLDWMLPGLSGIELCRRWRAREETAGIPIIMLTARGEEEERVRGLATGELQTGDLWHRLWKEMKVSLMAGLVCALILAVVVITVFGNVRDAEVVGLSLMSVILQASVVGGTMPIVLKRFNIDPAIATGPFITTSNDILGVTLYLGLVNLFL